MSRTRAAIDLGASSGRVIVGRVSRDAIELTEVARFGNAPVRRDGGLFWNWPALIASVEDGLRAAATHSPDLSSVGIDSWAVDHGLLADGRLLDDPRCYRDDRHASGAEIVHAQISRADFHAVNGLQFLPFTTAYQLAADPLLGQADAMVMVPDLITWHVTGEGEVLTERTNASTTGLLNAGTRDWDDALIERLGLPRALFGDLVDAGTPRGHLRADLPDLEVITTASHDTAAAVAATPLDPTRAAYVSLGTWALVGVETTAPVLSEAAQQANFTNEGGVAGTTRFLRNVMGTWLLSECLRDWGIEGDLTALLAEAASLPAARDLIDVDDPLFLAPDGMVARVQQWLHGHGLPAPDSRAGFVRLLLESIAAAIASTVHEASELSGVAVEQIHVVGGGVRNEVLCQLIADHCGLPVLAGPVEATAIGNLLGQGGFTTSSDLARGRAVVAASTRLRRHQPAH